MDSIGKQLSYHDAHAKPHESYQGDKLWVCMPSQVEKGARTKLAYKWKEPYILNSEIDPMTFILRELNGKILPGTNHVRYL